MAKRWEDKRVNRYSRFYTENPYLDSPKRLIKESENFFFKKNLDEGPPVKRGLGIDFNAVLKMLRIFAKELWRKGDDEVA